MSSNKKVRVAIIGVGNCASSLVQGVHYYRDAKEDDFVPGLMHVNLGGYHIRDIEFSAALDIDANKVGKDLSEAIYSSPNNTYRFADVPKLGVKVYRGMTHDGLGKYLSQVITKAPGQTEDIVHILKETRTDVVINYLPVGSETATKWYVEQILKAGVGMVNCIPVFIARENYWQQRFKEAGLPIIGDDNHPSFADPPLPRARRQTGAHDAIECRRQHRLLQYAGTRPPRIEKDQQNQRGHQPA
jgi:myo-inositol-1-phosphate synthase